MNGYKNYSLDNWGSHLKHVIWHRQTVTYGVQPFGGKDARYSSWNLWALLPLCVEYKDQWQDWWKFKKTSAFCRKGVISNAQWCSIGHSTESVHKNSDKEKDITYIGTYYRKVHRMVWETLQNTIYVCERLHIRHDL